MLDVVHVFFEEDLTPLYENHLQVKSQVRTHIYETMYRKKYLYKVRSPEEQRFVPDDLEGDLPPETSTTQEIKPYIPPTDPSEFPGILEPPMN